MDVLGLRADKLPLTVAQLRVDMIFVLFQSAGQRILLRPALPEAFRAMNVLPHLWLAADQAAVFVVAFTCMGMKLNLR